MPNIVLANNQQQKISVEAQKERLFKQMQQSLTSTSINLPRNTNPKRFFGRDVPITASAMSSAGLKKKQLSSKPTMIDQQHFLPSENCEVTQENESRESKLRLVPYDYNSSVSNLAPLFL